MRFRHPPSSKLPQVDLIPMLNVMMGILAFFVMITMTLSSETLIDVQLPADSQTAEPPPLPADPFIVELVGANENAPGTSSAVAQLEVRLNGQPIALEQLEQEMTAYLRRNSSDTIFLLPSQDLPYEQVMQFLGEMRRIGGNRVSLAIEGN